MVKVLVKQFKQQKYSEPQAFTAESYTNKDEYIYFVNNVTLYEFAMTSNPKFNVESRLSGVHYADRSSITTNQIYIYVTGGIEPVTSQTLNTH